MDSVLIVFGKGNKERKIHLGNESVKSILKMYKKLYRKNAGSDEYFFINRYGKKMGDQAVRLMIKKYSKKAGLSEKITPHMFRHTFATLLLEEDVDIRYIQQILGHSSISTTQIYTHISQSKQRLILATKNPRNKIAL